MQTVQFNRWRLIYTLFLVGIASFVVHELAHWMIGTLLGYPLRISPNRVSSLTPMLQAHSLAMSAAGPLATYLQALIGYALVRKRASLVGFAMVYMAFFMRLVAMGVSLFNPNDEARISQQLGLGLWILPGLVVLMLLVLVFAASRRLGFKWREQRVCYVVASLLVTLVVGADLLWFGKS